MKKMINIVIVVLAIGMTSLYAMPDKNALEKARPLIQELMADDFAALKVGKKTYEAVGDAAMKLLSNAETEAAKFLLCKAAFGLYIRGKAYDKAADVLETFRESISDLPPADLVDLVQTNAKGVRGKDAPNLFATYRALQTKATAEKERDKVRTALADNPSDANLRRTYAEWCVHAGDWKSALASFAKLEGDFANVVQNESSDRAAAADFWWNYEPLIRSSLIKDSSDAFRRHAVLIYKRSLKEGALTGLKKSLAEKRIAQFEETVATMDSQSSSTKVVDTSKLDSRLYVQKGLIAQWDGIDNAGVRRHNANTRVWKDLKGNVDILLQGSGKVESNCVFCDGSSYAGFSKKKISSKIVSAEIVFEFISATETACIFSTGIHNKDTFLHAFVYAERGSRFMFGPHTIGSSKKGKAQIHMDFESGKFFNQGVKGSSVVRGVVIPKNDRGFNLYIGGFLNSAVQCRIYSVRLYNRALSDDEVSINYKIDKERFGF